MNCYLCRCEAGNQCRSALAICQYCGGGICEEHLIQVKTVQTAGMAGGGGEKVILTCCRCFASSPSRSLSQPGKPDRARCEWKGVSWWGWLRRPPALPSPDEAIDIVEQLLHHERRQER
jgi:hypothetical protein